MATNKELEDAFLNAHNAGDTANAQILADEIFRLQTENQNKGAIAPEIVVHAPRVGATGDFGVTQHDKLEGSPYGDTIRFGGGVTQGLVIDPVKAVANLGVAGALKAGLIDASTAKAFAKKEQELQEKYNTTFEPSEAGKITGELLLPIPGVGKAKGLASLGKSMAVGAGLGGGYSASTNDPSDPNFLSNVAQSAGAGAIINPLAGKLLSGTGEFAKRTSRNLQDRFIDPASEYLYRLAGSPGVTKAAEDVAARANARSAVDALRAGDVPSTAPAIADAQKKLTEKYTAADALAKNQAVNLATVSKLDPLIGAPDAIDKLSKSRKLASDMAYSKVRSKGVIGTGNPRKGINPGDDDRPGIPSIIEDLDAAIKDHLKADGSSIDPYVTEPLTKLRDALMVDLGNGQQPATDAAHIAAAIGYAKKMIKDPTTYTGSELVKAKNALVEALPGMTAADAVHANYSKQIDKIKVAQQLQDALKNSYAGDLPLNGSAFQNLLNNQVSLIKKSTGEARYPSLEHLFDPVSELPIITDISSTLEDQARRKLAESAGSKMNIKSPSETTKDFNTLNKVQHAINWTLDLLGRSLDEKMKTDIAQKMLRNPNAAADMLESAIGKKLNNARRAEFRASIGDIIKNAVSKPASKAIYGKKEKKPSLGIDDMAEDYNVVPQTSYAP